MPGYEIPEEQEITIGDSLIFDNPSRGSRFEVQDFEIPDLTIPEGRVAVEKVIKFKVESSTIPDFECMLKITRHSGSRPVLAATELYGTSQGNLVFGFRDALFHKSHDGDQSNFRDGKPHTYWSSGHRKVEPAYTGKGVAEFFLAFREKLVKKLAETYPELEAEWMEVVTEIAGVANLVVDQGWLEEHGLSQYSKKHGVNLGYVPDPNDEPRAERLLSSGTTRLGEIDRKGEEPIKFIKRLSQS